MGSLSKLSNLCQDFNVTLSWAIQCKLEYLSSLLQSIGDEISEALVEKANAFDEVDKILVERWLKKKVKEYKSMEYKIGYWQNPDGKISDEDIQRARDYPISDLLEIKKKGNICCPFHDDKHPSASIKNNRLHCFACNETWDAIDIIIKKEGLNFTEAVKLLIGGETC